MLSARFMYFMNGSLVQQVMYLENTTWGYIYVMEVFFLSGILQQELLLWQINSFLNV